MPGWFDFINGQTLPASRVQEYLMDQSVMKFADSGSRAAALPFPTDGMVSYLTDIDRLFVYRSSSSAWVQIAESTNLAALSSVLPARRNAVINGAMDFWQRSTSASVATFATQPQAADRWTIFTGGAGRTVSRQNSGLDGVRYAMRIARDSGNTATNTIFAYHQLETSESIPFANTTVTVSFYARRGANFSPVNNFVTPAIIWGTGIDQNSIVGYTGSTTIAASNAALTTSWQRFERTFAIPATSTEITFRLGHDPVGTAGANDWYEVTGVQLEAGSVATPFVRAGGTLQGELAACQRYYWRSGGNQNYQTLGLGTATGTSTARAMVNNPVPMRVPAFSVDYSTLGMQTQSTGTVNSLTTVAIAASQSSLNSQILEISGSGGLVAGMTQVLLTNNSLSGFLGFSAEL
jgi:hypothetical protein